MKRQDLTQLSINKLSDLYIEKEELFEKVSEDIESKNFLKNSFEYRELVRLKKQIETDIVNINKEMQSRK